VAIPPDLAGALVAAGHTVFVERSELRIFDDAEYVGCELVDTLPEVDIVFGVKEVPSELLEADTAYVFFAHVIKAQPYNMGMLRTLLDRGCTLLDYERIVDADGRRLVFFGRFAGLAGAIDALWTLGERMTAEGVETPFAALRPSHGYGSLDEALDAVAAAGEGGVPDALHPLIVGVTGGGNVSRGAMEVLDRLPIRDVTPDDLPGLVADPPSERVVYRCVFQEAELVVRPDGGFDKQEYYDHPDRYVSRMPEVLPYLSMLVNGIYWSEAYPRVVRLVDLPTMSRCKVIADISCDIRGSIEATLEATEPGDPVYVVDPATERLTRGVGDATSGPVINAVDILPAELPRDASNAFAAALAPFVAKTAEAAEGGPDLEALPDPMRRAVIVHRGALVEPWTWLQDHV
jgi:alpha-aminoadipic semialdehyde synthase